jgi:hybrid cluster-associated redox disulfide protein
MAKKKINKDMMIGEVVKKYPNTASVMFKYGLHCIGCHVAAHENIEQGCKAHGFNEEDIDNMVKEMNEVLEKE